MRSLAHVFIAILALTGCSTVEPTGVETGELSGSIGVLHVERSVGERSVGERSVDGSGRTVLRAAFARYQGIDGDSVVRLLGSGSAADLGTCALVDPVDGLGADNADVELLDVGALHVAVADTEARLSPRTFPDLASVLAGVFYAGDAALAMPEPEVDEYELVAEGGVEVGAFEVIVPAPAAVGGVELVGADGTSARLDGSLTEITRSGALTVLWDESTPTTWRCSMRIRTRGSSFGACASRPSTHRASTSRSRASPPCAASRSSSAERYFFFGAPKSLSKMESRLASPLPGVVLTRISESRTMRTASMFFGLSSAARRKQAAASARCPARSSTMPL